MIREILRWLSVVLLVGTMFGCDGGKVPLNKDQFTALLIDMHRVDGTLSVDRMGGRNELKNYAYYNDIFRKYGIGRADFDSCMYYYSAQTLLFSKMYDIVIDSLNRQLTSVDRILNELKAMDSVNYFPLSDTLRLDSIFTVRVDSIVPGLYKFSTTIRFDSVYEGRGRRISSFFLSDDGKDTLKIYDIRVSIDTNKRTYNWSQYTDSVYSRLVISFLETLPAEKKVEPLKGRWEKPKKKEKAINLKDFGGQAWDNQLFRPYVGREAERRLKLNLPRR